MTKFLKSDNASIEDFDTEHYSWGKCKENQRDGNRFLKEKDNSLQPRLKLN